MAFKDYLESEEVRLALLKQFSGKYVGNWQDVPTPADKVADMVGMVKDTPDLLYCVLFNIEFLEELIYARGIDRDRIMIMADSPEEAALAMGMYGVKTFELPTTVRDPKAAILLVAAKIAKAFYNGGTMPVAKNLVVMGNPPYNSGSNEKDSKPIYHLFTETVIDHLNPRFFSFIMPSRWMAGGKGLDKFRARMMEDKHLRIIKHFPGSHSVFGMDAKIDGGVSYFLWDGSTPSKTAKCEFNGVHRNLNEYDLILTDSEAVSILDKVLAKHGTSPFLDKRVLSSKPFGLRSDYSTWTAVGVRCVATGKEEKLVGPGCFTDRGKVLSKWKSCIGKAFGESKANPPYTVLSTPFTIEPGCICTESYMVLGAFPCELEAQCFNAYVATRFFRFLVLLRKVTGNMSKGKFSWVPDLGTYTTAPTDAQLFAQFGLSQTEIDYINKRVK